MPSTFDGRTVLVTGAAGTSARRSRRSWPRAVRGSRSPTSTRSRPPVAKIINAERAGSAHPLAGDVSAPADVRRMVDAAWDALGPVDTLVNCVAITDRPTTVLELADERWDQVLRVCLTSAFLTTKYFARRLVDSGAGGVIIHIGSTSARIEVDASDELDLVMFYTKMNMGAK